jgi:GMP synthase (glutamine-hydrolysing)
MKIGILIAGHLDESMFATHGDIDKVIIDMLQGQGFEITSYAVCDNHFPADLNSADGWIISGSIHCANDDIDWINKLKALVLEIYDQAIPLVGICFGHQVIAAALGGKVEQFCGGWGVGGHEYQIADNQKSARIIAWHQDQVVEKPQQAKCVGSSGFCENAFLVYENKAFTMQPHPEFSLALAHDLLAIKQSSFNQQMVEQVQESLQQPLDSVLLHNAIGHFFKTRTVKVGG